MSKLYWVWLQRLYTESLRSWNENPEIRASYKELYIVKSGRVASTS